MIKCVILSFLPMRSTQQTQAIKKNKFLHFCKLTKENSCIFFQDLTYITWLYSIHFYSNVCFGCQARQGLFFMSNCSSENKLPCLNVGCEPGQTFPSSFTAAQLTEHHCFTINTNVMLIWSEYVSSGLCLPYTVLRQSQDTNIPLSQPLTKAILFPASQGRFN